MISRRREKLLRRLDQRRSREREGLVLVEGARAAREVLDAGAEVLFALVAEGYRESPDGAELVRKLEVRAGEIQSVSPLEIRRVAPTETPQGLLLVVREPRADLEALAEAMAGDEGSGRLLLLDAVQDPGNLGTLLRTAHAFDLTGVVVLDGSVDPWNPKAVRAAAGTGFHRPVARVPWSRCRDWLEEMGVQLLAAHVPGEDPRRVRPSSPWALAVGNEGVGPREDLLARARVRVAIPMPGGAESLNAAVAGTILLYELSLGASR